jgi:hypothetical protein
MKNAACSRAINTTAMRARDDIATKHEGAGFIRVK